MGQDGRDSKCYSRPWLRSTILPVEWILSALRRLIADRNPFKRLSPDLLRLLRVTPAGSRSDEVLAELLRFRSKRPAFTDAVLVLAFVPMLHRTVRRVLAFQPSMAEEDVVQQTLGILLQFLGSDDLQARQSHFAFAISRAVKREASAWAAREGSKHAMLDHDGDAFPPLAIDEPFERYTQLRHFLNRCVLPGRPHRSRAGSSHSVQTGERERRRFRNAQRDSARRSAAETQAVACQAPAPGAVNLWKGKTCPS